jgi:hypothetical protein
MIRLLMEFVQLCCALINMEQNMKCMFIFFSICKVLMNVNFAACDASVFMISHGTVPYSFIREAQLRAKTCHVPVKADPEKKYSSFFFKFKDFMWCGARHFDRLCWKC